MRTFDDTLDDIYQAAIDGDHWSTAIGSISALFGGRPALFLANDTRTGALPLSASFDIDDDAWPRFSAEFSTVETNPTLKLAMSAPLHVSMDQAEAVGEDLFRRSAINNELYAPQGCWPFLGTIDVRSGDMFAGLAIKRSVHGKGPERHHHQLAERISVHLGRAMRLLGLCGTRDRPADTLRAVVDRLSDAVFVLTDAGEIVCRNEAADALLERGIGLGARANRLTASAPADHRRLTTAIRQAARGQEPAFMISSPDGAGHVVRLQSLWSGQAQGRGDILLTVRTARRRARFDHEEAADLFGLTPAEAKVACEVCACSGIEAAARNLSISPNTVKSLLRRAYEKTGARSQSELAMLFATSLSGVN